MGVGAGNGKVETWDVYRKSKGMKKKKRNKEVHDGDKEEEESGCWFRFRFIGNCISSRSKVDSSISGTSAHCGKLLAIICLKLFSFLYTIIIFVGYV